MVKTFKHIFFFFFSHKRSPDIVDWWLSIFNRCTPSSAVHVVVRHFSAKAGESGFPVARSLTIDRQGRVYCVSIGGDYWATRMSAVQEIDHTVSRQTHSPLVS